MNVSSLFIDDEDDADDLFSCLNVLTEKRCRETTTVTKPKAIDLELESYLKETNLHNATTTTLGAFWTGNAHKWPLLGFIALRLASVPTTLMPISQKYGTLFRDKDFGDEKELERKVFLVFNRLL